MKFLVTGFPPYDQFETNSSQLLIESMIRDFPEALVDCQDKLIFEMIHFDNTSPGTQRETMIQSLFRFLEEHGPDACLFCGQGYKRSGICLEKMAINFSMSRMIEPGGPAAYWSTLPETEKAIQLLRDAGIPAKFSFHAGVHLCNHVLYSALHYAHSKSGQMMCGFMHVPLTEKQAIEVGSDKPFMPLEMSRKALTVVILHYLECMTKTG